MGLESCYFRIIILILISWFSFFISFVIIKCVRLQIAIKYQKANYHVMKYTLKLRRWGIDSPLSGLIKSDFSRNNSFMFSLRIYAICCCTNLHKYIKFIIDNIHAFESSHYFIATTCSLRYVGLQSNFSKSSYFFWDENSLFA